MFELEKCGGIVGSSYIFEFSRTVNCKWQFLSCTAVAFSELYRPTLYRVRFLCSMLFLSDFNRHLNASTDFS